MRVRLLARFFAPNAFFSWVGLGQILDRDLEPILATRRRRNAATLRVVSLIAALLVLVQFFVILVDSDIARRPAVYQAYLFLFASGFAVSIAVFLLWTRFPGAKGQSLYMLYVLAEGVGLTVCDLQLTGDYSTYILVLFGTALLYSASLSWYLVMFSLCWAALMGGLCLSNPAAFGLTAWAATGVLTVIGITAAVLLEVRRIRTEFLAQELGRRNEEWREASLRDALTGLYNRRFLFEWVEKQLAVARRSGQPLAVALIDLDHFKKVNDEAGHDAGDRVLRQAAALLGTALRDADVVARYGGEEFVVVLPETDGTTALAVLERTLAVFRETTWEGRSQSTTFSAGLTLLREGETVKDLFRRADDLLYRAKRAGRNQVVSED